MGRGRFATCPSGPGLGAVPAVNRGEKGHPVPTESKKILVIGGGIAGLCAAVYARQSGYQAEVLEMNDVPGGLAMSWRRGAYTFETCLHWLAGSRSGGEFHNYWQELFDISQLRFVDPDEMIRIENEQGDSLSMSTDLNRLEATLLERAPADAKSGSGFPPAAACLAGRSPRAPLSRTSAARTVSASPQADRSERLPQERPGRTALPASNTVGAG